MVELCNLDPINFIERMLAMTFNNSQSHVSCFSATNHARLVNITYRPNCTIDTTGYCLKRIVDLPKTA